MSVHSAMTKRCTYLKRQERQIPYFVILCVCAGAMEKINFKIWVGSGWFPLKRKSLNYDVCN